jgi:transcriptional regulator EpsA
MQVGGCQVNVHTRITGRGSKSGSAERRLGPRGGAALLHPEELESLLLNIDASLRVHSRHQLFGWTQGMLQSLVKHELLVCALRSARPTSYQVDCFASPWIDPEKVSEVFRRDGAFVAHLVSQWVETEFHPVVYSAGSGGPFARDAFTAELQRLGAEGVIAHGTYDSLGKPVSLFVLAAMPGDLGREQGFLLELIVPFLHLAWMRTQLKGPLEDSGATAQSVNPLSAREREILRWIHLGKSNSEIGTILGISPLTVKNHVQKILRKLNVQNRTHAVGRALELRILDI